jgi:hypothetical protein
VLELHRANMGLAADQRIVTRAIDELGLRDQQGAKQVRFVATDLDFRKLGDEDVDRIHHAGNEVAIAIYY